MENQKKSYLVLLISSTVLFILNIVLFFTKIYKWWLFLIICVGLAFLIVFSSIMLKRIVVKLKKLKEEQIKTKSSGNYNVDLYTVLGIPVQYNEDGSVKNIYELLGIDPVYDENGNRILTIYELLQIMPTFNKQGKEIPSVTVIKNRVGRIAKVDVSDRVLTRKLTDEEKEMIAIREVLTQKLKEAEKQGDAKKQEAIKKVMAEKKKGSEKKEESKPVKYKLGKAAGAIGSGVIVNKVKVNINDIFGAKIEAMPRDNIILDALKKEQASGANAVPPQVIERDALDDEKQERRTTNIVVLVEEHERSI